MTALKLPANGWAQHRRMTSLSASNPAHEPFRVLLLQRREALLSSLSLHQDGASRVQHARDLLSAEADGNHSTSDADRTVDLSLTDHEQRELAEIGAALARLDAGRYGLCADCGADIAVARLQVQPQALRCLACEAAAEARTGSLPPARL